MQNSRREVFKKIGEYRHSQNRRKTMRTSPAVFHYFYKTHDCVAQFQCHPQARKCAKRINVKNSILPSSPLATSHNRLTCT